MPGKEIEKMKILFLCSGNSCRSQMAEAWTRHLKGEQIEAYSAGVNAGGLDPRAVKAMAEAGVDISGQKSKLVDDLPETDFDYVITLCDQARETCPFFPAKFKVLHRTFDDPPALAAGAGDEEEAMRHYRRVRNEIKSFIEDMPNNLKQE